MKFNLAILPLFAVIVGATSAGAQTFQYDSRWYAGVRENVLELQDRHRARIEALEARRRQKVEQVSASSAVNPKTNPAPIPTPDR